MKPQQMPIARQRFDKHVSEDVLLTLDGHLLG
jgi:hypothetical protein